MILNSIQIGPVTFNLYGLMIGLGVVLGVEAASRLLKSCRYYKEADALWESLWWVLLFGLFGARVYHVVDFFEYYSSSLVEIIALWNGGLGIMGGIAGGALGLFVYVFLIKKKDLSYYLRLVDVSAFGLLVGQAVGRMGNFFNQELYGLPTTLPWGVKIDAAHKSVGWEAYSYFHPLFWYEMVWNTLGFLGLYFVVHKKFRVTVGRGIYLALYFIWYGTGRFLLEYLRIDPWRVAVGGVQMATAQLVALVLLLVGALWIGVVRLGWYEAKEK